MDISGNRNLRIKRFTDKLAGWVITVAGIAVIAAMFAMLALIVREAAPLFMPVSRQDSGMASLPVGVGAADVVAFGADGDLLGRVRVAGVILRDGGCGFATVQKGGGASFSLGRLPDAPDAAIQSVEPYANGLYTVLWDDGSASLYAMRTEFTADAEGRAETAASFRRVFGLTVAEPSDMPLFAMLRGDAGDYRAVTVHADGRIGEKRLRPAKGLRARGKGDLSERKLRLERGGNIVSAALNGGDTLYVGTDEGDILAVDLSKDGDLTAEITPAFRDRRAITSLCFLNGGYALAVGDDTGGVSVWFPRREDGAFRFRRSVEWKPSGERVMALAASGRDRGFFSLDAGGCARWLYSTNGRELVDISGARPRAVALAINARSDNLAMLRADGSVRFQTLDSSYPEAGWTGFFRRLLYEGYDKAAFVWQSTGSDESEPKLSLVPLIWGSVKAAVYALLFATPISLAAAMYLSQFSSPVWRARLKPAVEMLAAVPSVVIGFLAALWLAPLLERHLQFIAKYYAYDQRNSLVIAVAMGFAVIPTIFSLAEDAISSVPPSLSAASLALGASKWQTVWRVVLPTASPGIFTAVMLGFGRAVGETMIVLMAAGNTPIISLSPFNGMRTLSANIAVEMPEAPVGGTLYRTLFLCALILFILTLVINTAAEVFRHRLRRRYGKV